MSDQMRQLSDIKWQATGVDGHTHHTCGEWMYTSDAPPVEADEYERMKQRAEAAEAAIAAVPRQAIDALFRQQFGSYAHRRIGELERALADEREGHAIDNDEGAEIIIDIKRQVERLKAIAPEGVFSPEDFSIINPMGDVRLLTAQLAAAIKRAEAAEAKLKEWETAANNNDPYVTNGGYVEVEVLEAVKRRNLELLTRAEAAERQIVANEARITELTRLKDELAEDASRERQRAEAAEARVVNWISTEERLPETQLRVLAVMLYDGRKPRIIRAMHIPAKTVECLDWEFNDAVVYDSESECHYLGAGWYELMEEGEYDYVGPLSDSVTHWAEMPELPEYFRQ